jgi:hypothetical protein
VRHCSCGCIAENSKRRIALKALPYRHSQLLSPAT